MLNYILRILGLVLIIAAFVTLVMLSVLGPLVLTPILKLRRDLAMTGETLQAFAQSADLDAPTPQFASAPLQRRDELGEVIATFRRMFDQIFQAVRSQKQAEHDLRANNQQMRDYLQQVDRVTAAAAALEAGEFQADSLIEVAQRDDELGMLARVFQTMAAEILQREALLRQQLSHLEVEIDQQKRAAQAAEILESDFFKEIHAEMERMRQADDFT